MNANMTRKTWSQPVILTVEQMRDAAVGTHLAKGPLLIEYSFDGPGS